MLLRINSTDSYFDSLNQGKPSNTEESFEGKTSSMGQSPKTPNKDLNGHQDLDK